MIKITQEMIDENDAIRKEIDRKNIAGEPLSSEEKWMMGDQRQLDDLPNFPECWDMYYRRLYLQFYGDEIPGFPPLSAIHLSNFQMFVHSWLDHLDARYVPGSLNAVSQKETNIQLQNLEDKWKNQPNIGIDERDEDLFELLAWSKFRYVLVRKIFELNIKSNYYLLKLSGKEIRFDYESAMHILSRHFAHGMKPYPSSRDHFYGVFRHDNLHKDFENIFQIIDGSGVYIDEDVSDINFKHQGTIYKIWTLPVDSCTDIYRISTFFPVSSINILKKLNGLYSEMKLTPDLSIFITKKN